MICSWQMAAWSSLFAKRSLLPHALLVSGRSGIGKLAFARLVCKALLCEGPETNATPCEICAACHWFDQNAHPDFKLLQPESRSTNELAENGEARGPGHEKRGSAQISVEQVRGLADFVGLTAHRRGRKVILLQPAEDLSVSAANALLKTLEEPPPETVFLLVTDRPHRVLATIRSRCHILVMPVPSAEEGLAWLMGQGAVEPVLALAEAGFAPFRALENAKSDYFERRKTFLGTLARGNLDPISEAAVPGPGDLADVLSWFQKWTYDLTVVRLAGRVRYNPDFLDPLRRIADQANVMHLGKLYRSLLNDQAMLNHPLNPRLVLERMFVAYVRCVQALPASPS